MNARKLPFSLHEVTIVLAVCLAGIYIGYNVYAGFGKSPKEEWFKSNYCQLDTIIESRTIVPIYSHEGLVLKFKANQTDTVKFKCGDSLLIEVRNYDD